MSVVIIRTVNSGILHDGNVQAIIVKSERSRQYRSVEFANPSVWGVLQWNRLRQVNQKPQYSVIKGSIPGAGARNVNAGRLTRVVIDHGQRFELRR